MSYNLNDLIQAEANNVASLVQLGLEGIPPMILHGSLDGRYYIVQEFIDGKKPHSSRGTFDAAYSTTSDWLHSLVSKTGGKSH